MTLVRSNEPPVVAERKTLLVVLLNNLLEQFEGERSTRLVGFGQQFIHQRPPSLVKRQADQFRLVTKHAAQELRF